MSLHSVRLLDAIDKAKAASDLYRSAAYTLLDAIEMASGRDGNDEITAADWQFFKDHVIDRMPDVTDVHSLRTFHLELLMCEDDIKSRIMQAAEEGERLRRRLFPEPEPILEAPKKSIRSRLTLGLF
jgi:hypothetical protein